MSDLISVKDAEGYVWTTDQWRKSAVFVETPDGPAVAEAFRRKGWAIVPTNPKAPKNRTHAEVAGIALVRHEPEKKAKPPQSEG